MLTNFKKKLVKFGPFKKLNEIASTLNKRIEPAETAKEDIIRAIEEVHQSNRGRRIVKTIWYSVGGFFGGFAIYDIGQNMADRFWAGAHNVDYSGLLILQNNLPSQREFQTVDKIIQDGIRRGNLDLLGWLAIGQVIAKVNSPELAFACYYMGHLKNHKLIKTNSDLKFDTLITATEETKQSMNIDMMLANLVSESD